MDTYLVVLSAEQSKAEQRAEHSVGE
jgi:hypothetical protein